MKLDGRQDDADWIFLSISASEHADLGLCSSSCCWCCTTVFLPNFEGAANCYCHSLDLTPHPLVCAALHTKHEGMTFTLFDAGKIPDTRYGRLINWTDYGSS